MNTKKIENTIGFTLASQSSYVTFTAIIMLSSIFEYTRNVFETNIKGKPYFDKLKEKYSEKVDSLKLLNDFRNTIHSNSKWQPRNKTDNLIYKLRGVEQIIKPGQPFEYDNWKIYRMIKDCLDLNKLMALDNKPKTIRDTRQKVNGVTLAVVETGLTKEDLIKIFKQP